MKLRTARILTGTYFTLFLLAVTWPGLLLFARIRPFVFGLPLSLAWIATWIAGSVVVLYLLDLVERQYRTDEGDEARTPPQPAGSHPSKSDTAAGGQS